MKFSVAALIIQCSVILSVVGRAHQDQYHLRRRDDDHQVRKELAAADDSIKEQQSPRALQSALYCDIPGSIEAKAIARTNRERNRYGLGSIRCNAELQQVAYAYSRTMCRTNCFGHHCDGSLGDRLVGINTRAAGENVAWGYDTPEAVMQAWMNSQGHRDNILQPIFEEIAIGVYDCGRSNGGLYWTMVLGNLKDGSSRGQRPGQRPPPQYNPQPFEDPKEDDRDPQFTPPSRDDDQHAPPDPREEPFLESCEQASGVEAETLSLVNAYRLEENKSPLGCNAVANAVARTYSQKMCETDCFGHDCYLSNAKERLGQQGVAVRMYREKIAWGYQDSEQILLRWKSRVLSDFVSEIGIGVHDCDGLFVWNLIVFDEYSDY